LRKLAVYDTDMPKMTIGDIPKQRLEALDTIMNGIPQPILLKYLHGT
jgi:hypothetical protein